MNESAEQERAVRAPDLSLEEIASDLERPVAECDLDLVPMALLCRDVEDGPLNDWKVEPRGDSQTHYFRYEINDGALWRVHVRWVKSRKSVKGEDDES